jgi:hypothetical protein
VTSLIPNRERGFDVSQKEMAGYWLTRILEENVTRFNDLPMVIRLQEFSHVRAISVGGTATVTHKKNRPQEESPEAIEAATSRKDGQ